MKAYDVTDSLHQPIKTYQIQTIQCIKMTIYIQNIWGGGGGGGMKKKKKKVGGGGG